MDIDVKRFYDDNYEIINNTKIRFFELSGPIDYMLPDRSKEQTNKSENTKKSHLKK